MSKPAAMRAIRPQPSLAERAADDLRIAILDGHFGTPGRLPAEPELARQLGVSRATLRHAISVLQDEGLVTRRHGSGTYVLDAPSSMRSNLNVNFGVTDLIEAAGWRPGTRDLTIEEHAADSRTAEVFGIPLRSRVVVITRTRTADDRPVAQTIDYLAGQTVESMGVEKDHLIAGESLYRSLESIGLVVHHGIAEIRPAKADRTRSLALDVPVGTLLLHVIQTDYTADGDAILISHEYYVADALTVQVYRKGSGTRT